MLALPRQHQRGGPDASLPKLVVVLSGQNRQIQRQTGRNYTKNHEGVGSQTESTQTNRQIGIQTGRNYTDKHTDAETDRQKLHRQIQICGDRREETLDRQTDRQTDRQMQGQTGRQTRKGRQTGRNYANKHTSDTDRQRLHRQIYICGEASSTVQRQTHRCIRDRQKLHTDGKADRLTLHRETHKCKDGKGESTQTEHEGGDRRAETIQTNTQMRIQTGRNYTDKHTDANTDKHTDANRREDTQMRIRERQNLHRHRQTLRRVM